MLIAVLGAELGVASSPDWPFSAVSLSNMWNRNFIRVSCIQGLQVVMCFSLLFQFILSVFSMWVCLNIGMEIAMCAMVKHSICMYNPPCNLGGGCWTPRFCRGPQRQVPCGHSTKSISALQGRDLPSTKSRTFHSPHIWQNQGPHMWRHQNKSKNITCWVKTSNDDSVEICVRVDSVEIFCWSLIL